MAVKLITPSVYLNVCIAYFSAAVSFIPVYVLQGRTHIFKIHARSMSVERDIRFELLARLCPNSTGKTPSAAVFCLNSPDLTSPLICSLFSPSLLLFSGSPLFPLTIFSSHHLLLSLPTSLSHPPIFLLSCLTVQPFHSFSPRPSCPSPFSPSLLHFCDF